MMVGVKQAERRGFGAMTEEVVMWSIIAASAVGVLTSVWVLLSGAVVKWEAGWAVPGGKLAVEVDALSAWFLLPLSIVGAAGAIYGRGYLSHVERCGRLRAWWWYGWLLVSMGIVFVARNAVVFLIAWEMMTVASFFLVMMEDEQAEVRRAGWIYVVAAHIGTAVLIVLFVLMGNGSGAGVHAGMLFVLALVGFGVKAGLVPLHVWLPEAHPVAPSHVSAVMSGVMIKTGVYGMMRMLVLLGEPRAWWGWSLIGVGVVTGVVGALHAIVQRDMKRLLAYSSVDNVGIIMIGLGCGVLGGALDMPVMSVCGYAGALLHVLHHALFKGLLFMGAGAVLHGTGTRELHKLGGLARRMKWTGVLMCVGVLAMGAAPLLNGCVSEALIFTSGLYGIQAAGAQAVAPLAGLAGLALTSGLAALCSVVVFGIGFLGEPRSEAARGAHEVSRGMLAPMVVLAGLCVVTGCAPLLTLMMSENVLVVLKGTLAPGVLKVPAGFMTGVSVVSVVLGGVGAIVKMARRRMGAGRRVAVQPTWGCGYVEPTARMQYTGMSFVQPVLRLCGWLVSVREEGGVLMQVFPRGAAMVRNVADVAVQRLYMPLHAAGRAFERVRMMQHGRVHMYLLYIVMTLLVLLLWKGR